MERTYENAEDTGRSGGKAVSSTTVFSREELGRNSVQDAVHDLYCTSATAPYVVFRQHSRYCGKSTYDVCMSTESTLTSAGSRLTRSSSPGAHLSSGLSSSRTKRRR